VGEMRAAVAAGEIAEIFACGTAAVITPVGRIKAAQFDIIINDENNGAVTMRLRDALLAIQHGQAQDRCGWMHPVY
jgi:branched-chain amino acid aminotransferase